MSDLYNEITSGRGSFERLLMRLPGFEGYLNNKARRTADRMVRDYIADQLTERLNRLAEIEKTLLDSGGLSYMSKTNSAKTKWQIYRDRLKAAAPGYSGFFAEIEIGPEQLETLYMFDELQIQYADKFQAALDVLAGAVSKKEGIEAAIADLEQLATEANEAFSKRENAITSFDERL